MIIATGIFALLVLSGGLYVTQAWWLRRRILLLGVVLTLLNWHKDHSWPVVAALFAVALGLVALLWPARMAHELNNGLNLPHPKDCSCGGQA